MKLVNFVRALLPRLEKDKVLEDLRITVSELDTIVAPNYKLASDYFRTNKLKSDEAKYLSDTFYKNLDNGGISKQPNFLAEVSVRVANLEENAKYISAQIEEIMERDIINEGLTAKKALLVRASEAISFASRYAIDLLNYVYIAEAVNVNAELEESMKLSPADMKKVEARIIAFARIVSDYGIPNNKFSKVITEVPDVIVNSKTSASISSLYKERDLDPLASSYVAGFTGNPIYHIRLSIAEWQASRYKANKDKKKMLELRLLHLKLISEKKNNPKIEAEIEYIQSRIEKIERYLRDVEESLPDEE